MKTLLAAIVGGILVFAWGAVSHMVLPLGTMGFDWIRDTDDEATVLGALKSNIPEDGLYFVPGADPKDEVAFKAAEERAKQGHGLVVWHPGADEGVSPKRLGMELVSNIAAAFVATLVVSRMRATFPVRVFSVALMGVFAGSRSRRPTGTGTGSRRSTSWRRGPIRRSAG